MLDSLRKKLTLLCTFITAAILIIITLISFYLLKTALDNRNRLTLMNEVTSIVQHLQNETSISHDWLAQQEINNHAIIAIRSKNNVFQFPGVYPTYTDRTSLIEKARTIGINEYHFSSLSQYFMNNNQQTVSFPIHTSLEHYLATITAFNKNSSSYELIVLKDMSSNDTEIIRLALIFIGLILAGILLLSYFSWWFAGKAIVPIKISQQEQTDFVAAASHELRSPVAVIQSTAEIMLHSENKADFNGTQIIYTECHHLSRLISDLLLLARTDSGRWTIHKELTQIDNLVLEIYDHFLPLATAQHHQLGIALPELIPAPILLDAERIKQVLSILIDNAIAYTPKGSQITLLMNVSNKQVELGVMDNGPGISNEEKANVFKRFYRLDSARKSNSHCGLGLSIAYEILKLHGTKLTLTDSPGGGCTFKFTLSYH